MKKKKKPGKTKRVWNRSEQYARILHIITIVLLYWTGYYGNEKTIAAVASSVCARSVCSLVFFFPYFLLF